MSSVAEGESQPLLGNDHEAHRFNGTTVATLTPPGHGESSNSDENEIDKHDENGNGGGSGGDDDENNDGIDRFQRLRAKRVVDAGGWLAYLREFSILEPYLIPQTDKKVQLCYVICIICMAVDRVLVVLVPRQLEIVTDELLANNLPFLALIIWLLLSLLKGGSGLGLVKTLSKLPIQQFTYRQLTMAAFSHVMSLGLDFHSDRDSAEVMKAIDHGLSLTDLLETVVLDILPSFLDLVVALGILYFKFNIFVALVMLVASVAYMSLEAAASSFNTKNRRTYNHAAREEARTMHQAVQGWQTVTYFDMAAYEERRFGRVMEAMLDADRRWTTRRAILQAAVESLLPITFFCMGCLALYQISQRQASAGDFVFLIQYWAILIRPLQSITRQYRFLMLHFVDAERLLALIQTKPSITNCAGAEELDEVRGQVSFKDVSFGYDSRKLIIKNLSISAEPGQRVALVGETGAGKSSIIKLLMRLYDVTSGCITIDDRDIRSVTLSSLR
jgi:ABC-type multidrug transport system fused ATPase/permease subunit